MTEAEPRDLHPLFGKLCNFEYLHSSNSSAECKLILDRVNALDSVLKAATSLEIACKFLWRIRDRSASRVHGYMIMFEKLLLWCFYIRKKFLLDLTDSDIYDFRSFYMSPSKNWIAKRGSSRFNFTNDSVHFNKDWRPYIPPIGIDGRKRELSNGLNRIIKEVLPNTTLRVLLPTDRYSTDHNPQTGDEDIAVMNDKYLDYLFGLQSIHGAHEIKLFLFACASYLKVDVRGFGSLSQRLYLNNIIHRPGGGFYWKYDAPYEQVVHSIPEGFGRYYLRYCNAVDFNINESYPPNTLAFQNTTRGGAVTRKTLATWFEAMPAHPKINLSPSQLLKLLARQYSVATGRVVTFETDRKQTSKIDSKKRYDKFNARLEGIKVNSITKAEESFSYNLQNVAFPILCLMEQNAEIVLHLNYSAVQRAINLRDCSMTSGYVASVRNLLLYTYNHLDGIQLRRPSTAYEILILWTMLIRRMPVCMLSEADAVDFFEFCCAPPTSWVTINTRRLKRGVHSAPPEYDPHWRPFRTSRGCPRARAALIITHCSQMQAWAIKCGLLNFNVFLKLTRKLWRGCE